MRGGEEREGKVEVEVVVVVVVMIMEVLMWKDGFSASSESKVRKARLAACR